ncbi:GrlR family regulatory protein [Desulfatiglans anilini]|uniref:GrlR family regulatory protein n=1 Tax=Desulfatiglans anilini TaxID=90728 RepID=UPI0009FD9F63|nr:GrlR family regulatory protein [Desulfatiglans anilini]
MDRLEGLWTVSFQSNFQSFGAGVAVFSQNQILGGDSSYYYNGNATIKDNKVESKIHIVRFNKMGTSIFGNLDSFYLNVTGNISIPTMQLSGCMIEQPTMKITLQCNKVTGFEQA